MCSTSAIVPVRWNAGIDIARTMPGGITAAAMAGVATVLMNVRRSVFFIKASCACPRAAG